MPLTRTEEHKRFYMVDLLYNLFDLKKKIFFMNYMHRFIS